MRTEGCACGDTIVAPSLEESRPYVQAHGRSLTHLVWRYRVGLATETQWGGPDDPQRHWPTADESLDLLGDIDAASASGAEGTA